MVTDTIEAVSESKASGEIAELYADIRQTLGVSAINLVWRHIATIEGGLRWAWEAARPMLSSGLVETECEHMLASLSLPSLPRVPDSAMAVAGVSEADRPVLKAILDTYNRGNALNMVSLCTLLVEPSGSPCSGQPATHMSSSTVPLPPIPEVSELSTDAAEQVHLLNELGAKPGPNRVIASIYKHVALWPAYLALNWAQLAPLHEDGSLLKLIEETRSAAHQHAAHIAGSLGPQPPGETADRVRAAVAEFTDTAIARMIPIGQMMRQSLGD